MACRILSTMVCADYGNTLGCSLSISSDGCVYSFGRNTKEGHGHIEDFVFPPKVIPSLKNITQVSCGFYHSGCVDMDGNVFTFGRNALGQLGVGKYSEELIQTHIPQKLNLPPIKQIACGTHFTMCLSVSGDVFSFGYNNHGQLGHGDDIDYNSPKQIELLQDIEFIECGHDYAACKSIDNRIYVWGYNNFGQLGIGNKVNQRKPFQCVDWPEDIVDIKYGYNHSLILTLHQDVYSCGNHINGQLGREIVGDYATTLEKISSLSHILRIECGYSHSMCIDIDNNFYIFGKNNHGQLGFGDTVAKSKIVKHPILSNIIDISSKGGLHSFVKTSNNEIYAFGYNEYSQLGIKTENRNQITPIRVFEDNEDIWFSNINKSKAKSARF